MSRMAWECSKEVLKTPLTSFYSTYPLPSSHPKRKENESWDQEKPPFEK